MKRLLLDNPGLKIISLILAVVIWLIVVNINDPKITRTITGVPVTVTNSAYLESQGLACSIDDEFESVSVTVVGNRSVVEPLTKDDILVQADLTQIVNMDSDPVMVPLSVSIKSASVDKTASDPINIQIKLEPIQSTEFIITSSAGETHPKSANYEVGSLTAEPESVTITGPRSLVNIIDKVVAQVDVSSMTSDATVSADLKIYDKNGDQFTDAQMNSLKFSIGSTTVDVTVDLWDVESDVQIKVNTSGTPKSGYKLGKVATTPEVISVTGTDEALEKLKNNGNIIEIPADVVDISNADGDFTTKFDINEYLPEGIRLAENVSSTVIVSVEITPLNSVTFNIPTTDINRINLGADLGVIYDNAGDLKISIRGPEDVLSTITLASLAPAIDFNGMGVGKYEDVKVLLTLPEECSLVSDASLSLEIFSNVTSSQADAEQ